MADHLVAPTPPDLEWTFASGNVPADGPAFDRARADPGWTDPTAGVAWGPREFVRLGDGASYYWDGAYFVIGASPVRATFAIPGPDAATRGTYGTAVAAGPGQNVDYPENPAEATAWGVAGVLDAQQTPGDWPHGTWIMMSSAPCSWYGGAWHYGPSRAGGGPIDWTPHFGGNQVSAVDRDASFTTNDPPALCPPCFKVETGDLLTWTDTAGVTTDMRWDGAQWVPAAAPVAQPVAAYGGSEGELWIDGQQVVEAWQAGAKVWP